MARHLLTDVVSGLDSLDDLSVNQICADRIQGAVVPGCEQLLSDGQSPGGVLLLPALSPHLLLALRHGIKHVLSTAAQRPHLETKHQ